MAMLTSESKSLDRHMAASFYPKMAMLTLEGKSSLQNATRGFLYIRKWHSSLQGASRLVDTMRLFYPEMAKVGKGRQI